MDVQEHIDSLNWAVKDIDGHGVLRFARAIADTNGTVYVIGNGGSASNAEHAVNDFLKVAGVRCMALTSVAPLTAYANDTSYAESFVAQFNTLSRPGDTLLAISVSGCSPNIMRAIEAAEGRGNESLLLMGRPTPDNAHARELANDYICVHEADYGIVETVHQGMLHIMAIAAKELL